MNSCQIRSSADVSSAATRRRDARATLYCLFPLFLLIGTLATAADVLPVLEFPEAGMDSPARYKDYRTRFYQDSQKNTLQIYLNQGTGRVVNLWADSANESLSFTARDSAGQPVALRWCGESATATAEQNFRFVQYSLCSDSSHLKIGHFLLGSMRKERDFQYFKKDLAPYDSEPFHEPELLKLITNLEKIPHSERSGALAALSVSNTQQLRNRMDPSFKKNDSTIFIEQISFDGKNHLSLQLIFQTTQVGIETNSVSIKATGPVQFKIKVGTDAAPLNPLDRKEIFNDTFLKFYNDLKNNATTSGQAKTNFRWIDREVQGMELVCYQDKLMAGLPNFATYFGRDTMMSAFMFEPIWSVSMMEHAISSVLRKVSPRGEASHEEALGGQAIRENADQYNKLIEGYLKNSDPEAMKQASAILRDLQRTRENYNMIDDDFQLPVLIGRYLNNPRVEDQRKRAFLEKWIKIILRNFAYVSQASRAYVENPDAIHLVSFPRLEDGRWMSASWRDSGAGYAGGRFGMDVNAVWVPGALESIAATLQFLKKNGYDSRRLESLTTDVESEHREIFLQYVHQPEHLQKAIDVWQGAIQHFWVRFTRDEFMRKVQSKIESLPDQEKTFWRSVLKADQTIPDRLEFLALSLDESGKPIPVLNTDPATWLFLGDHAKKIQLDREQPGTIYKVVETFLIPYPVGLYVENLGPLCANDSYASSNVWQNFERDQYHSPRVVWGREVNLLTLGLVKEILQSAESNTTDMQSYGMRLRDDLAKIRKAVEGSGLKHNELWSYEISDGKLQPIRYGSSSDVQLWNLTDLSIQFLMSRIDKEKP
ncbi:hypothetical protein L0222_14580 [bacterium]|nr:hypothetical protein [bacterium]MCI0603453.1 hypothetical protein [bacterium]